MRNEIVEASLDRRQGIIERHPCLSEAAHGTHTRVHMPVAPRCNIQCRYCVRKFDCANESRPGVTSRVLGPVEAYERVLTLAERSPSLSVVGIAGPGDPLANDETFEFLGLLKRGLPHMVACVSTNGLMLPGHVDDLVEAGVGSLTVTINAVTAATAERIYAFTRTGGTRRSGPDAMADLLERQWGGLMHALKTGMIVKVNTVYAPGVNDHEIPEIAARLGLLGVELMNVMPLIPQAEFAGHRRPSCGELDRMRALCEQHVAQMRHCKQCRADAFGPLGSDGDMDLELLNAHIGQEYCESVL
jgi:nitrogen fixation protein NifB